MGLADAGRSQQEHVLLLGQEGERGQIHELRPIERGLKGEVEGVDGLEKGHAREPERILDPPLFARGDLLLEEPIEEGRIAGPVLFGALEGVGERFLHSPQSQSIELGDEPFVRRLAHRTPPIAAR